MTKAIFLLEKLNQVKIDQALELGIDAIFVGHKNLTKDLIKKARSRGIKFYVEIGIFVGNEWWKKYPNSQPVDQDGEPMEKIHWYAGVCPNHSGVKKEKLGEIKELIKEYEIDGIWLDFTRYPCHWEKVRSDKITEYCFCQNCLEKYKKDVIAHFSARWKKRESKFAKTWMSWKCDQITNFVAEVRTLIDQSGKNIKLGMFSVPWRGEDFDGAIKKVIGQDFKSLAKYIDVFSPMTYQKFCDRNVKWIGRMVKYMAKTTGKPILPIVQTENRAGKINREEFEQEVSQALDKPSSGVIVFFLEDLLKDKDKIEAVKEQFA